MAKTVNLKGKISLDDSAFRAGVRRVQINSKALAKNVGQSFRDIGKVMANVTRSLAKFATIAAGITFAAAIAGAVKLSAKLKEAFDLGGQLSDISAQTGVAVKDLVVLRRAFEDAGVSADAVGITLNRLTRRTQIATQGNNSYAKALETLGLNAEELAKKSQADRFWQVADAINRIGINSATTAAAMDLLDTSAGQLFGLFQDANALENAAASVGSAGLILEKNAATFDRISDLLNGAGEKLQQFFVGIADVAAPKILEALERFNKIDFADIGQRLAAGLNLERLLELLKAIFDAAAAHFGNALVNAAVGAFDILQQKAFEFGDKFAENIGGSVKKALKTALLPGGMLVETSRAIRDADKSLLDAGGNTAKRAGTDQFGAAGKTNRLKKLIGELMGEPATALAPSPSPMASVSAGMAAQKAAFDKAFGPMSGKAHNLPGLGYRSAVDLPGLGYKAATIPANAAHSATQTPISTAVMAQTQLAGKIGAAQAGGFSGLANHGRLQLQKSMGIGPGSGGSLSTGGLRTGALGAVRKVGKDKEAVEQSRADQVKDQMEAAREQVSLLEEQNSLLREGLQG